MTTTPAMPEHTIGKHDHPEPHTMCWSELELAAIKRYAESYALATLQAQPADVSDGVERVLALAHAYADAKLMRYGQLGIKDLPDPQVAYEDLERAILALRPQSESEQEKELRRSLAEAQATISERNAEIIELQKRIHRSPQAVPMTDERLAEVLTTAYGSPEWTMDDVRAARAVEAAALGITAPAGGEVE